MSDPPNLWLTMFVALAMGCFGYVLARVVARLLDSTKAQARMRSQNERMLSLIHQIVELENEKLLAEQELAQIVEREGVDILGWHHRVKQIAGGIAPLVLETMKRFGLASPPPLLLPENDSSAYRLGRGEERTRAAWANWDKPEMERELAVSTRPVEVDPWTGKVE